MGREWLGTQGSQSSPWAAGGRGRWAHTSKTLALETGPSSAREGSAFLLPSSGQQPTADTALPAAHPRGSLTLPAG